MDADYFRRIEALNFSLAHDDGQSTWDLHEADVILMGVSRTSKTPTSIYLANRGVKTGNIPLVPGVPYPPQVETLTRPLVIGLFASPERIVQRGAFEGRTRNSRTNSPWVQDLPGASPGRGGSLYWRPV